MNGKILTIPDGVRDLLVRHRIQVSVEFPGKILVGAVDRPEQPAWLRVAMFGASLTYDGPDRATAYEGCNGDTLRHLLRHAIHSVGERHTAIAHLHRAEARRARLTSRKERHASEAGQAEERVAEVAAILAELDAVWPEDRADGADAVLSAAQAAGDSGLLA